MGSLIRYRTGGALLGIEARINLEAEPVPSVYHAITPANNAIVRPAGRQNAPSRGARFGLHPDGARGGKAFHWTLVGSLGYSFSTMFDKTTLNDLARRLAEAVPSDFLRVQDDLEKNFRAILQASAAKMNLVSREEFEVQTAVLARTREQLERLETRVAELEKQILDR